MLPGVLVKCACVAAVTVITLDVVIFLPHASVNDHVSVTVPPQVPGAVVCVEVTQPVMRQPPLPLFVYCRQVTAGIPPQATVILPGGFTKCACVAAVTVIVLNHVIVL